MRASWKELRDKYKAVCLIRLFQSRMLFLARLVPTIITCCTWTFRRCAQGQMTSNSADVTYMNFWISIKILQHKLRSTSKGHQYKCIKCHKCIKATVSSVSRQVKCTKYFWNISKKLGENHWKYTENWEVYTINYSTIAKKWQTVSFNYSLQVLDWKWLFLMYTSLA